MRQARIKAEGAGYYHCMSRIIERRFIFRDREKRHFHKLMRAMEGFSGINILTYSILSNHFHILLEVPERIEISDREFVRRLKFIYEASYVKNIADTLKALRQDDQHEEAERIKARYTYRMYDVSEFFKTLKQKFSQWYNKRSSRNGTLWEQRFKSILVEGSEHALLTMAAYIDLNSVRAGLVDDPRDYRYCGYGEAVAGQKSARKGICRVVTASSWREAGTVYRKQLYIQGSAKGLNAQGGALKKGFSREEVEQVLESGGKLSMPVLLRCKVRYFSDGLVLGSKDFVDEVYMRYKDEFGLKRSNGARGMRYGEWGGLCTMRDLKLSPVSVVIN